MRILMLTIASCVAVTFSANAETISGGKMAAGSEGARSFEVHWKGKDLKAGEVVSVTFRREANGRIADVVAATIVVGIGF
jgi:hypothetical protein